MMKRRDDDERKRKARQRERASEVERMRLGFDRSSDGFEVFFGEDHGPWRRWMSAKREDEGVSVARRDHFFEIEKKEEERTMLYSLSMDRRDGVIVPTFRVL